MQNKRTRIRIVLLMVLLLGVFCSFGMTLAEIQIVNGESYQAKKEIIYTRTQRIKAARGEIVDRHGQPLAVNKVGYDITFNRAFFPSDNESINTTILRLSAILLEHGESWIDNLPLTETAPFEFLEGRAQEIRVLKEFLGVEQYAGAEDVVYWLRERFGLQKASDSEFRIAAGVRYEMHRQDFSLRLPYTFAQNVSMETVSMISENSQMLAGVIVEETPVRDYVAGNIAPHIIGMIGPIYAEELEALSDDYGYNDLIGKSGVEKEFEQALRGTDGEMVVSVNQRGEVVDVEETVAPIPGRTVMLTISKEMQQVAQLALERQILHLQQQETEEEGNRADAGAVVVIDVKTGDILAAATYPSYDLGLYYEEYAENIANEANPFYNRALDGLYAAGSTYKPAVAIGALTEGTVTQHNTVLCSGIYTFFSSYQPTCMGVHGNTSLVNSLRVSCNIYFYDVGRLLGIDGINKYSAMLGLGQATGIEIPEKTGHLAGPDYRAAISGANWEAGDVLQAAIGQSDNAFTPLQLANYAATLANDGRRMNLNIVKSIVSYHYDKTYYEAEPAVEVDMQLQGVDAESFAIVREGMKQATFGTAYMTFGDYPISVASKTGTPETGSHPNAAFICYAPADDPEIAIAVVIENGWHGYSGAPVARDIFDYYFFRESETEKPDPVDTLLQ